MSDVIKHLDLSSADGAQLNMDALYQIAPSAFTEVRDDKTGEISRKVNFEVLRQLLGDHATDGEGEMYQFTWVGKTAARAEAAAPTTKTLRPVVEDSVDWDTTKNIYIEGDNLEVLKLLQETYLGKIKMIYIDPPYNTGNDFVYNDDFAESTDEYLANSGQFDEEGNRLFQNTESNGRFHTDWLNMIYPRLKLAKDLLSDDGVIFISIDDNEVENLRKCADEVFGEDNFITSFIWAAGKKNDSRYASISHEYMLCYVKSLAVLTEQKVTWRERKRGIEEIYNQVDSLKKIHHNDFEKISIDLKSWYKRLPDDSPAKAHSHYNCIDERGVYFASDISWPGGGGPKYEVLHPITGKPVKVPNRGWVFPTKARMQEMIDNGLVHFGKDENSVPCRKTYLKDSEYAPPYSVFYKDGRAATKRLRALLECAAFQNPKDEEIIANIIEFTLSNGDCTILDFFSGSATTAHAVMQLNAEDGGHRKFIMVQLPEETDEKSEAYKAGYKNICEIGKERIRRAAKKIAEENPEAKFDGGFRVFKCDSTNMKDVYYNPADFQPSLLDSLEDNIKEDRTPEDLLFQVMLDLGVLLSAKIEESEIAGKKVFNVEDNYLIACFDSDVTEETIKAIAKQKPYYFVMRDSSMANDSVATNFEQIFATYSPETIRRVL